MERFESLAGQRYVALDAPADAVAIAVLARSVFDDPADEAAQAALEALAREVNARPADPPNRRALVHAAIEVTPDSGDARGQDAARTALFRLQAGKDAGIDRFGSWDPYDQPACRDGPVGQTSLCVASLWRIRRL